MLLVKVSAPFVILNSKPTRGMGAVQWALRQPNLLRDGSKLFISHEPKGYMVWRSIVDEDYTRTTFNTNASRAKQMCLVDYAAQAKDNALCEYDQRRHFTLEECIGLKSIPRKRRVN